MKKSLLVISAMLVFVLTLGVGVARSASDQTGTCDVSASVADIFTLSIPGTLDLGNIATLPGAVSANLVCNVKTNQDAAWYLKVESDNAIAGADLLHTDGTTPMTFKFWETPITDWTAFTTDPQTAYEGTGSTDCDVGAEINVELRAEGNADQKLGDYSSTVTVTLTETM